ncbi:MAG: hypothetical protein M3H12_00160 [Chromatiales bacterium]|nr:hypothetical protein [Gammaproteobacteria bacterium]
MDYPVRTDMGGDGKFSDGNPGGGVEASLDMADDQNQVYDELIAVIQAAGVVEDHADRTQLLAALQGGFGLSQSLATNGYATFPGGLIIQWGQTTTLTSEGSQTITLPIVWPNAGLVAHATPIRSAPVSNATAAAGAVLVSNNQITLVLDAYNSAGSSGVYWFAIGW